MQAVDAGVPKRDAGQPRDAGFVQTEFTVSVEVKGLEGRGMVLRVNGINDLPVSTNGFHTFEKSLTTGDVYAVTVGIQPSAPTQTCTVDKGTGTITNLDIDTVVVKCVTNRFTIGGTVVGLTGLGLTLRNNGKDAISVTKNGTFVFPITYAPNDAYEVTVFNQPVGPPQICTVSGATGNVGNSDVVSVVVNCDSFSHTVGGTVAGLNGSLTIRNNGTDTLTLTANGSFAFGVPIASNGAYSVEIVTQPGPNQNCYVDQGIGTVGTEDVTSIRITCQTDFHFIGGTLSGLSVDPIKLSNNGGDLISLSADGVFRFPRPIASGMGYDVKVAVQPSGQRCAVTRGTGTVDALDVTSVAVACAHTFTVGGTVNGASAGIVLTNNGEDLVITRNGIFTFTKQLLPNETYAITVKTQPIDGQTLCVVEKGVGTVTNANIVAPYVRCRGVDVSCAALMISQPGAQDGQYYIDPDGSGSIAPFEVTCDMTRDNGGWMLVTPSMVAATGNLYANIEPPVLQVDVFGGVTVRGAADETKLVDGTTNCGVKSFLTLYLKDTVPWSLIRSTWSMSGNGYCWSIFGDNNEVPVPLNLVPLSYVNDVIRSQSRMGPNNQDAFDGVTSRCSDSTSNFWSTTTHSNLTRSAEVILRRASSTKVAGLGLAVSCSNYVAAVTGSRPSWRFSDIWIK